MMRLSSLSHLLIEQVAVVAAIVAYLTGIVTVRPHPLPPEDLLQATKAATRHDDESPVSVNKTVIVIIDALRADHLVSTPQPLMPHLHGLLAKEEAHGYILHTATPTVTLPRIKSLVTGSIPGFMDIIENFGAGELTDDNLIRRWVDAGKRIYFYGDDTWLKLFPSQFSKHDAVTSFFVTDYTEVDRNVTRHISKTMASDDWDVLILHYLGLDHIGHLEGPMSPLIGPKLLEMDSVIKNIHLGLEKKGKRYLVVVCGDHGMSDAGGHGGSSHSEVTTSSVLFSNTFGKKITNKIGLAKQVDLTSTLAFLTGVGIPEGNIGQPLAEIFSHLGVEKRMSLHHNSAKQLLAVARGSGLRAHHDNAELLFEEATRLHKDVLEKLYRNPPDPSYKDAEAERVCRFYLECQQVVSEALASKLQSYDLPTIFVSTSAVVLTLTVSLWRLGIDPSVSREFNMLAICWGAGGTFVAWLLCCAAASSSHICYLLRPTPWLLAVSFIYILVMIPQLCTTGWREKYKKEKNTDLLYSFLLLGTGLHTLSLLGTSLVEEEHQTAYFLINSLHMGLILKIVVQSLRGTFGSSIKTNASIATDLLGVGRKADRGFSDLPTRITRDDGNITLLQRLCKRPNKLLLLLIVSLILNRLMRSWNSTGDKWKHLEDLGDVIRAVGGSVLVCVVLSGLVISLFLFACTCLPLVLVTCGLIFGRHFPYWGKDVSSGTFEAQMAHLAIVIVFVYGLFKAKLIDFKGQTVKTKKALDVYEPEEEKMCVLMRYIYTSLSLLCLLLQRVDNIGLMSLVLVQNWLLCSVIYRLTLAKCISWEVAALSIDWLAFAHFFYQGNSNSLTTVDISAGFVGVTSYHPFVHGILIATQTFGGSLLTYLAYLTYIISKDERKERWQQSLNIWWCARLATISLYLVNVAWQRHHLFIWSVFTPKLLYEGAHILVLCFLTLFMWSIEKVCTVLEVTYRFE
ncbi:GPI ethanolamine phosphate transferase 2-like isoform X1 [Procambarus clarkii]|uniref:GPI ethanolamine phosphate transferase 2-like isoform X1 n=2 Tax=Procambarus clarkii TaxID=6728 RepID=UPI00374385F2